MIELSFLSRKVAEPERTGFPGNNALMVEF